MSNTYLPLTSLLHANNHLRTQRVCTMASTHYANIPIIGDIANGNEFSNLNPGIYGVTIDGDTYYFDLYIAVAPGEWLIIKNKYLAYAIVAAKRYPIILYKYKNTKEDRNAIRLYNTINEYLNMIIVDGASLKSSGSLTSISSLTIATNSTNVAPEENSIIDLKNNIKSLPSGRNDLFILNAEQQQCHIVYNIARKVFSGGEDWQYVAEGSNSASYLFYLKDDNVIVDDTGNNILCSQLAARRGSKMIPATGDSLATANGIALGYLDNSRGFYVRLTKSLIEEDPDDMVRSFRNKLVEMLVSGTPMIVEYALENPIYKTTLIDEYHIDTFFANTYLSLSETRNVSYFYKSF